MSSSVAPLRARAVNIIICKTEEEKHSCRFGGEAKDFSLRHVSGPAHLDLWDFQKGGGESNFRSAANTFWDNGAWRKKTGGTGRLIKLQCTDLLKKGRKDNIEKMVLVLF